MKKTIWLLFVLIYSHSGYAEEFDASHFAKAYFDAWQATQSPNATMQDIEHYLGFLHEDVGHQHLPYSPDDTRYPTGKADMKKGMSYYLASHQSYSSTLLNVVPAHNVVVITYETQSSGIHPQTQELVKLSYHTMEVLEIEDGKVSVIRKYEE